MAKSYTIRYNEDGSVAGVTKTNDDGTTVEGKTLSDTYSKETLAKTAAMSGESTTTSGSSKKKKSSGSSGNSTADAVTATQSAPDWLGTSEAYDALDNDTVQTINRASAAGYSNVNDWYKSTTEGQKAYDDKFFSDPNIDDNTKHSLQYWKEIYDQGAAVGDYLTMANASKNANLIREWAGYAPSNSNVAITDAIKAAGGVVVDMRDKNGVEIPGGAITINGKAYDLRTGQEVAQGTQVYSADGQRSWVKNDIQYNGTPYINNLPSYDSPDTITQLLGLPKGALDMQSPETVARSLGLSSLAEIQDVYDQNAETLKVLRQSALDKLSKDTMETLLIASNDVRQEMYANLANEALAGGSEGAHAANIVSLLLNDGQKFASIFDNYNTEMKNIEEQHDADIAAGRINADQVYTERMFQAEQAAQTRLMNQLALADIAASIYAANSQTQTAMNNISSNGGGTSGGTQSVIYKKNDTGDIVPTVSSGTNAQLDQWIEQADDYIYDHSQGLWANLVGNGKQRLSDAQKAYIKQMALNNTITPTGTGYDDDGKQIAVLTYDDIKNAVIDFMGTGANNAKEKTAKVLQDVPTYTKHLYKDGTAWYSADTKGLDYDASNVVVKDGIIYDKNDTKFKKPLGYIK